MASLKGGIHKGGMRTYAMKAASGLGLGPIEGPRPPPPPRDVAPATLNALLNKQGYHKVWFGTDFPLASQAAESEYIGSLPLSDPQTEGILGENARLLIGL